MPVGTPHTHTDPSTDNVNLRELIERGHYGAWVIDADTGALCYFSPLYARILGKKPGEVRIHHIKSAEQLHPDDRNEVLRQFSELSDECPFFKTHRIVLDDGTVRWVVDRAVSFLDANSGKKRIVGTTEDVTERCETEEALRESQRAMATLLSNLPGMAYRCRNDQDWSMEFVSEGCLPLIGYRAEDVIENRRIAYADLIHPEDRDRVWRAVQDALAHRNAFELTYRIRTANGLSRWVWEMGRGVFNDRGDLLALEGFVANDTERRGAEQALRESERRYRTLVETSPIAVVIHRKERFVFANPAALSILNAKSNDDVVGRSIWDFVHPDFTDVVKKRVDRLLTAKDPAPIMESRFLRVDGVTIDVEVTGARIQYAGESAVQTVFTDITERKRAEAEQARLEAQLHQSQKMEAIGQLAGGVAHDFNNILTAILGHLGLARESLDKSVASDHAGLQNLQHVERAAERAADLVRQLLVFSRKGIIQPTVVDLNARLVDSQSMLERLIDESIALDLRLHEGAWRTLADPSQLDQVILNLVVNARDAMPDGGILCVETRNTELTAQDVALRADTVPGRYVVLRVTDTGAGMTPETTERIFEPFFTTKDFGKGSGLGLAMVHGIVRQCGGHIAVESKLGSGTAFSVFLPATDDPTSTPRDELPIDEQALRGTETVLVCEDESSVRGLAARILMEAGYNVLVAENGEQASNVSLAHDGPVTLLLTDVIMPNMNGYDLAERLQHERPELRTLFMSGYTSNVIARHGVIANDIDFLDKPFSRRELLQRVRRAIEDKQAD